MEKDPAYIAKQVKFLRKMHGLTQENLADSAGITTRTIEKIESGRHAPDQQTLRSIARVFCLDEKVFNKPSAEQEAKWQADMQRVIRKTAIVETTPVRTAADFLAVFAQRHALRFNNSEVTNDQALELAAALSDQLTDLNDIWDDCYMSQRLEYARSIVDLCRQIEAAGYICYMGHHRQQRRYKNQPPLVFDVNMVSILPKEGPEGTRYGIIELEGGWETLEEDRLRFPEP
jgi:transcriptional regulator with XRE-family HTH domain